MCVKLFNMLCGNILLENERKRCIKYIAENHVKKAGKLCAVWVLITSLLKVTGVLGDQSKFLCTIYIFIIWLWVFYRKLKHSYFPYFH